MEPEIPCAVERLWGLGQEKFTVSADTNLLCTDTKEYRPAGLQALITRGGYEDDDIYCCTHVQFQGMVFPMNNLPSKCVTRNTDFHRIRH